ncbi:LysE family transporter [Variovorax sp. J22P240]|uniref:LysE family translocator n=1 Tax=Variovorax sp. J22P240 TaxID=3053514 RepID=UPI002577E25F|nr:LysE family transporter [Variovorax sp. J22P240]MDL9998970.1 LysE family transporter [Variovorax sp. J22P240]
MNQLLPLLGIAGALAVGVVSPGPSFVMVARTAVSLSRLEGVAAAFGMGAGGACFALAALAGLQALLLAVPTLFIVLKVAGGLYLAYLGVRIWLGARQPLSMASSQSGESGEAGARRHAGRSFLLGLATQLSNPKTAIVYASVFAAFMPASPSLAFGLGIVAVVFVLETSWYALVALALSAKGPQKTYLRYKAWADRVAGAVMVSLGLRLLASAHRA